MESKPRDKATETRRVPSSALEALRDALYKYSTTTTTLSGNYKGPYATLQQFFYLSNSNYTLRAY